MRNIKTFLTRKYNMLTSRIDHLYQRALAAYGIEDCPEMQVVAAVAAGVALWYACIGIQALINIIVNTAPTLTALVTQ